LRECCGSLIWTPAPLIRNPGAAAFFWVTYKQAHVGCGPACHIW
jgi:hypothetical protein